MDLCVSGSRQIRERLPKVELGRADEFRRGRSGALALQKILQSLGGLRPIAQTVPPEGYLLPKVEQRNIVGCDTSLCPREHGFVPWQGVSQLPEDVVDLDQFGRASQRRVGSCRVDGPAELQRSTQVHRCRWVLMHAG